MSCCKCCKCDCHDPEAARKAAEAAVHEANELRQLISDDVRVFLNTDQEQSRRNAISAVLHQFRAISVSGVPNDKLKDFRRALLRAHRSYTYDQYKAASQRLARLWVKP